jgi:hypothetical protein
MKCPIFIYSGDGFPLGRGSSLIDLAAITGRNRLNVPYYLDPVIFNMYGNFFLFLNW